MSDNSDDYSNNQLNAVVVLKVEDKGNGNDCETRPSKRRSTGGRNVASVWSMFTNLLENPHKLKSCPCRHCNFTLNHHKKGNMVKAHLNKCTHFHKYLNGLDDDACPEWYVRNSKLLKRNASPPASSSFFPSPTSASYDSPSMIIRRQSSIKDYALPKITRVGRDRFQVEVALYLYSTGYWDIISGAEFHLRVKSALQIQQPALHQTGGPT
jgi:hypothetical protein